MWWPIVCDEGSAAGFDTGEFHFEQVLDDIESLNHRAQAGELEITAISCAQYPYVADRYALTACGSSMGDNYGPKIEARDWSPGFSVKNQRKDLGYCAEAAESAGAAVPGTLLVDRLLGLLEERGDGELASVALYDALLEMGFGA